MSPTSTGSQYRSRKVTSAATVLIYVLGLGTPTLSLGGERAALGGLSIVTDPAGASVFVNGESKGVTPLRIAQVAAGDHRVTVVKEGYLENSRVVSVEAGRTKELEVRLTSSAGEARHTAQIQPGGGGGGGGVPAWVWIAAAAGGGTAAYFLLRDTNEPPTPGSVSVNPANGLQSATSFSISSQGASDPDGDALTFSWELGDGTTGSGQTVSKVYNTAGTFTATVTVSDGEESVTASGTAVVRGMTGTWRGNISGFGSFTMNLTQTAAAITGTYSDFIGTASLAGNVSAPNSVRITATAPGFSPFTFQGTTSGDVNTVSGSVTGSGFNDNFTMSRQ